mmetsp:Transcript_19840/g.44214  ORF Transcript_19840/g.44214 Transcript_19840/m.44214 type:complete len:395 (-) Transcript_19840:265-1449(-)
MNANRRSWANLAFAFVLFSAALYNRHGSSSSSSSSKSNDQLRVQVPVVEEQLDMSRGVDISRAQSAGNHTDSHPTASMLHPQCYRENPTDYKNRPVLLFKYSRTGSTWLAWTGKILKLQNKRQMMWNWEVQDCNRRGFDTDGLVKYFVEYYTRDQNGTLIDLKNASPDYMKLRCLHTVDPKVVDDGGPLIATINPHETHEKSPPLDSKDWKKIFDAVPNLAVGVLVRTNSVKRAISYIASEKQKEQCGSKKLKGGEDCIKNLPQKLSLDLKQLWKSIHDSEVKRDTIPEFAAQLSKNYGDGKMFCLTYEEMENGMASQMEAFGKYIGAEIKRPSLEKLKKESSSYKRGSNDLSDYIVNYDEVREMISSGSKCILEQLESQEPKVFPSCNLPLVY